MSGIVPFSFAEAVFPHPEANIDAAIVADGDLRRAFARGLDLKGRRIGELMHPQPASIHPDRLAVEAVEIMEQKRINGLLVCANNGRLCGALNMHDLFAAKVI